MNLTKTIGMSFVLAVAAAAMSAGSAPQTASARIDFSTLLAKLWFDADKIAFTLGTIEFKIENLENSLDEVERGIAEGQDPGTFSGKLEDISKVADQLDAELSDTESQLASTAKDYKALVVVVTSSPQRFVVPHLYESIRKLGAYIEYLVTQESSDQKRMGAIHDTINRLTEKPGRE